MLPQSDYNVISSGNNGYSAAAGYNLVTGLGTPVANALVPDLIAYQGPGTTYSGPTVARCRVPAWSTRARRDSGPMDVFSVFDSLTVGKQRARRRPGSGSQHRPRLAPERDARTGWCRPDRGRPRGRGRNHLRAGDESQPGGADAAAFGRSRFGWSVVSRQWSVGGPPGQSKSQVGPELPLTVQGIDHDGTGSLLGETPDRPGARVGPG